MAKNYLYNLLLTLANILFPILTFPYVSHVLGPQGVGHVQFVFTFAQNFGVIAGLGIPIYGFQEVARYRDDPAARSKAFSEMMVIYIASSLIMSVLYISAVLIFPYFKNGRDMYWAALPLVLLACSYIDWVYTGMELFKPVAIRSVLFKVIVLILLYSFVHTAADYKRYLYIIIFAYLGNNLLNIILLRGKVKLLFSGLSLKRHIKPLLFILGTTITIIMADMDTVLLGFMTNHTVVGYYSAADKLSAISVPIVTSLAVVLMPKMGKFFADNDMTQAQVTLGQAFNFLVFLGVPIAVGITILAPQLIHLFMGDEFLPATNSLRLLSAIPLVIGFSRFFQHLILVPAGKNGQMFTSTLWGLAISLLLNIVLIPFFNQLGASVANLCSEIVVTSFYFMVARRYFSFNYPWALIGSAFLSSLVFIPVVWAVNQLSLPLIYMLLVSVTGCAIGYFAAQMFVFKNNLIYDVINIIKLKLNKTTGPAV